MDYFSKYDIAPLDGIPFFRSDEIKCIAEALSDLPHPVGSQHWSTSWSTSGSSTISQDVYMTYTRGIIVKHLMEKIYAKDDLELLSRIQGAIDDDMFRHNVYFVLETLRQAEVEIRETATQNSVDPDFGPLDNYIMHSCGFDGTVDSSATIGPTFCWGYPAMSGNDESILSLSYMELILTGLNGGRFDSTLGKGYPNDM